MEDWFVPKWRTKGLSKYYYSTFDSVLNWKKRFWSSRAREKAHTWSNVPPHPSLQAVLHLGAIVRMKLIRCFVPVISLNYCKYTFYFIAIFKSECWCRHANSSFSGLIELFSVAAALNLSVLLICIEDSVRYTSHCS